jgi:predicted branched-subunit amino acid permease
MTISSEKVSVIIVSENLPILEAVLISLTNLTSAGQLAGLSVIAAAGTLIEMAATQFVINLRYALMSISLSQKLDQSVTVLDRLILSFGVTDENFAIAVNRDRSVTNFYFFGLMTLPILCWTGGTFFGAAAGEILPASVLSALGVAIYGMFVAIVLPVAKKSLSVALVALLAIGLSCAFAWVPGLNAVSGGFAIIISAIIAALVGAFFFPREEDDQ